MNLRQLFILSTAAVVPAGALAADPQVRLRGMVVEMAHPTLGPLPTLGTPLRAAGEPALRPAPPPALGQHTGPVLRDLLGYPDERIEALRRQGVIA